MIIHSIGGNSPHYLDLLSRFEGLKNTSQHRWIALCPAHNDTSPSLSLQDVGDKLLVKCWAGCSFYDVAGAIDARPSDFFLRGETDRRQLAKGPGRSWRDTFIALREDVWFLLHFANHLKRGLPLYQEDNDRLITVCGRVEMAWRACQ